MPHTSPPPSGENKKNIATLFETDIRVGGGALRRQKNNEFTN
jgi:hypothetical protein